MKAFISHPHRDKEIAAEIDKSITDWSNNLIEVVRTSRLGGGVPGNAPLDEQLIDQIKSSNLFFCIRTRNADGRPIIAQEFAVADQCPHIQVVILDFVDSRLPSYTKRRGDRHTHHFKMWQQADVNQFVAMFLTNWEFIAANVTMNAEEATLLREAFAHAASEQGSRSRDLFRKLRELCPNQKPRWAERHKTISVKVASPTVNHVKSLERLARERSGNYNKARIELADEIRKNCLIDVEKSRYALDMLGVLDLANGSVELNHVIQLWKRAVCEQRGISTLRHRHFRWIGQVEDEIHRALTHQNSGLRHHRVILPRDSNQSYRLVPLRYRLDGDHELTMQFALIPTKKSIWTQY